MNENVTLQGGGRRISAFKFIPWTLLLIAYMVARNLPGPMFDAMRPPARSGTANPAAGQ